MKGKSFKYNQVYALTLFISLPYDLIEAKLIKVLHKKLSRNYPSSKQA